ncbi:MAG: nuclear transport factor 2 family protein [Planctomycetes bacterium]|nr:nuclear transport factor 2 family protein [Planctomycetota bacterium]
MRHRTGSAISTALLSAASALLMVSCASRATQPQSDDARAVAERFIAAFGAGELEKLRALFAAEIQWDLRDLHAGDGEGRDALMATLEHFRSIVPDARIEEAEIFVDGTSVMIFAVQRGRLTSTVNSIASRTERELGGRANVRLRLREGRIDALRWNCTSIDEGERLVEVVVEAPPEEPEIDWIFPALDLAGSARAFTLDPKPSKEKQLEPDFDPRTGERRAFGGFPVTGSAPIVDEVRRRELSRLLYRGLFLARWQAACFQPRHALEIDGQDRKLWVVICFECLQGYFEAPGRKRLYFKIAGESEPGFSEIYRSLGLTVAPKID